mmetsp:Transcript_25521/g.50048  ORF Transcript_25521/g.50048 Transcript_25521/m.50048 type:complete len:193 (-) Transcript_25521:184-762(-)
MKLLVVMKRKLYAVALAACSLAGSHALSTSGKRVRSTFDPVIYMPNLATVASSQNVSVPEGLTPVQYDMIDDDVPHLPQDLPDPPPPPPVPPPKPPAPPVPPAEGEFVGPLPALMLLPQGGGVPAAEIHAVPSLFEDYPIEPPRAPLVAVEQPPTMAHRYPDVRGVTTAMLEDADPQQMAFPMLPPLPRNAL